LQKSGVLRKAIDHIRHIEEVNRKLCDENKLLRNALQAICSNKQNIDNQGLFIFKKSFNLNFFF
jgi:hypothetical protein